MRFTNRVFMALSIAALLLAACGAQAPATAAPPAATQAPTSAPTATASPEPITELRVDTPENALNETFAYIQDFWPQLTFPGDHVEFALPEPFVAPGDSFDWFFYWDSYFIITGLTAQGDWELAKGIVDDFLAEVETYGMIPNYNAPGAVCASRSQPPYLTAAIEEVWPFVQDNDWLERAYQDAKTEYMGYWMVAPHLTDTGLSRYYDPTGEGCVTIPDTPHFRAMAETGWDNTPRFGDDVSQVLPVDLNAQLYRYEVDLGTMAEMLGHSTEAAQWRNRATRRQALIDRYLWDTEDGFYRDYDLRTGAALAGTPRCLDAYVALWAGVASPEQAASLDEHLPLFEQEHGLATCEPGWDDGTQHNYPVGWAYSHWYTITGLRKYGYDEDAGRLAIKWLRTLASRFEETGILFERYNVVAPGVPAAGRYPVQEGFGWTNAVYASLLARVVFGTERDWRTGEKLWDPILPPEWAGQAASISLPGYPWPGGVRVECPTGPGSCVETLGQ